MTEKVSNRKCRPLIGKTLHVTSPMQSCIHWLASPNIRNVGLVFDVLEMDEAVHQNLFLKLIFYSLTQKQ